MDRWKYRELKSHHAAWLSAHPDLTKEWLWQKLREGFDVHHLDGNHSNDDSLNLVLIYHPDHMLMHAGKRIWFKGRMGQKTPVASIRQIELKKKAPRKSPRKLQSKPIDTEFGKMVYRLYEKGRSTGRIAQELNKGIFEVSQAAQEYAKQHNLIWPFEPRPSWDQFGRQHLLARPPIAQPVLSEAESERRAQIRRNSPWLAAFQR